jgi:hypothetical protein
MQHGVQSIDESRFDALLVKLLENFFLPGLFFCGFQLARIAAGKTVL